MGALFRECVYVELLDPVLDVLKWLSQRRLHVDLIRWAYSVLALCIFIFFFEQLSQDPFV